MKRSLIGMLGATNIATALTAFGLLAILAVLASTSSADTAIKVYVLTGQSNSLGTLYAEVAAGTDYSPGADPADAATPFFWSNFWSGTIDIGDSGGAITTLQMQQGYDTGSYVHPAFWGPEFGFARKMHAQGKGGEDILIVKVSRAGGGNTYWSKEAGGHMYNDILSTVSAATDELDSAGKSFEIAGLMYLQGESDSTAEAAIAGTRLGTLISNLRADLPNAANMYAVIAGVTAASTNRDTVRTQQAALAAADPMIDYFSNLDVELYSGDNLHLTKASKLIVGERFADAFLAHELPEPDMLTLMAMASLSLLAIRRKTA
ncbi:MAG: sialate O-acetylesterase [Planctomycetota bacterium]|nr:sialate O-acetylesterase [Planctomycetota bacterium]